MLGVAGIGVYLPRERKSSHHRKEEFEISDHFIEERLGVASVAVKGTAEDTSDLAVAAFRDLQRKTLLSETEVQCLILVTQNPDFLLPHTSAIVHGKLGLPSGCACFDVSLGCSGFVYGLSVIESFMTANGMTTGVLITADPYSKIIDQQDKNTALLFGDGATATLIREKPLLISGKYCFGTMGDRYASLICAEGRLSMNGRAVFDFVARTIPGEIERTLVLNGVLKEDVDLFILHQGSKYMIQILSNALKLDPERVPFTIRDYGNTVSSSIPILLEKELSNNRSRTILVCGFGVGLSWASGMLYRASSPS